MAIPEGTLAKLLRLRAQGESKSSVARKLGVSRNTVRRYWQEAHSHPESEDGAQPCDAAGSVDCSETGWLPLDGGDLSLWPLESKPAPASRFTLEQRVATSRQQLELIRLKRQQVREENALREEERRSLESSESRPSASQEVAELRRAVSALESKQARLSASADREPGGRRPRAPKRPAVLFEQTGLFHCVECAATHELIRSDRMDCVSCGGLLAEGRAER